MSSAVMAPPVSVLVVIHLPTGCEVQLFNTKDIAREYAMETIKVFQESYGQVDIEVTYHYTIDEPIKSVSELVR